MINIMNVFEDYGSTKCGVIRYHGGQKYNKGTNFNIGESEIWRTLLVQTDINQKCLPMDI